MTMLSRLLVFFQALLPQHLLSRALGRLAESQVQWIKNNLIRLFIKRFCVDMSEANESDPFSYSSFNDFFTRALKPNARPIHDSATLCSPADGQISQLGAIRSSRIFQAKGQSYFLQDLLADSTCKGTEAFSNGKFMTIYLSPRDYHRVHMPVAGELVETRYVPGRLFSVNQKTTEQVSGLFARNERLVCLFETDFGPMAMVLVGAMIVGQIESVWAGVHKPQLTGVEIQRFGIGADHAPVSLAKGAEMGRFKMGSTVILLLPPSIQFKEVLRPTTFVRMGEDISV